jgi:hypothetical protein
MFAGQLRKDERELTDLRQAQSDGQRGAGRMAEQRDDEQRGQRLGDQDDGQRRKDHQWLSDDECRVEEHPHRHEEQHGEGIAHRQRIGRGLMTDRGLRDHHARQERPEGHRRAEEGVRCGRNRDREDQHREREQLARSQPGDLHEDPRDRPRSAEHHDRDQGRELQQRESQGYPESWPGRTLGGGRIGPEHGDQHEDDDGEDVLDQQPPDRDVALGSIQHVGVHQYPHEDDGARHGHRHADHGP